MFTYRMKRDLLGRALRLKGRRCDSRRDVNAVICHRRNQACKLQGSDAYFLSHRDCGNRNFRPAAHRLGHTASFSRKFDAGLLAESETADVSIEAVFAQAQSDFDGSHIAGFGEKDRKSTRL